MTSPQEVFTSPLPPLFLLREVEASHGHQPTLACPVEVRRGISSPTEAIPGKPLRQMCQVPWICLCMLLVGGSVSERFQKSRLIDSFGLLVECLFMSGSSILLPTLPPESQCSIHCLALSLCICFSLLLCRASQRTVMLGSCL